VASAPPNTAVARGLERINSRTDTASAINDVVARMEEKCLLTFSLSFSGAKNRVVA